MSFEKRKEEQRLEMERSLALAQHAQQQELEALQRIHAENRNHPVFQQMREIANSAEVREAFLAYYETFKNRPGQAEINMTDSYDVTLNHKAEEPFGIVRVSMDLSDPYEASGGDAWPITVTDALTFTLRGINQSPNQQGFHTFFHINRYVQDGSSGGFSSYNFEDILNNIAQRIVRQEKLR